MSALPVVRTHWSWHGGMHKFMGTRGALDFRETSELTAAAAVLKFANQVRYDASTRKSWQGAHENVCPFQTLDVRWRWDEVVRLPGVH